MGMAGTVYKRSSCF